MSQMDNALKGVEALFSLVKISGLADKNYPGSDYDFRDRAKELYGLEYVGGGYYSVVFTHPSFPNLVIKVGANGEEDMSAAYLAWARKYGGPHVPRVHHLSRGPKGVYFAVLDKLTKNNHVTGLDARTSIWELHQVANRDGFEIPHMPVVTSAQRAWLDIIGFFDGAASFDLHADNIMFNLNGELVITDPLGESRSDEKRHRIEEEYGLEPYKEAA